MGKIKKIKEAEVLLEKYYEGMTTVAEEKHLHDFLSQENLPACFDADKALLGYFAKQKTKKKAPVIQFVRWASVAAVFLAFILTTGYLYSQSNSSYVYINGERYTDISVIKDKAIASIKEIAESPDEVKESTRLLTDNNDLVEQQISLFTEFN